MSPPVFNIVSDRRGTYPISNSSSSPPPLSLYPTIFPRCRTREFYFPSYSSVQYLRTQPASIHGYVSRVVGIAGRSGVLQKKTQKNAPPFTCTPTFSFRDFGSRKLITFISESQEVVPPGPVLSLSRARISLPVTGMMVSLSTMPKRTPPRLPSRP